MLRFVIVFILLIFCADVSAQNRDTIVDGKPFKIHEVQPRETLFGISRLYNVDLNQLVVKNPVVIEGLHIGYPLLIPTNNIVDIAENEDTLQTPIMEFSEPINEVVSIDIIPNDSCVKIALLLPFYLDLNDSLRSKNGDFVYPKSQVAIDYSTGFQIALDTLKAYGFSADIMYFDVPNDSVLQTILSENILFDRDIIFGPLHIRHFEQLAKHYGYDKNKTLISPLSHKSVSGNYLNVVQATPTAHVQLDSLTTHLLKKFSEDKIVVMGYSKEYELIKHTKDLLSQQIVLQKCKVVSLDENNINNRPYLQSQLDINRNVVIIPSNNRAFVSRILPILSSMEDTSITVYGLETWNKFDNLDFDDLEKLNVHIPIYTPKSDKDFHLTFVNNYINKFGSYPSKYAFSAYWQALYFLSKEFNYLFNFKYYNSESFKSCTTFDITQFINYQQINY